MNRGPYTALASEVLFPIHERIKGHATVSVRRAMEQSQWWDPQRLEVYRLERLRALLARAKQQVPYYRGVMDGLGFEPNDLRSLADIAALPFLTKSIIRGNLDSLKAADAVGLARFNTGGSSGEPLVFLIGKERVSHDVAAKWRATRWWDVDIGDREIVVWGSPIEVGAQDRVRRMRDFLLRSKLIPAFEMSSENLDAFVAGIRSFRPRMLFGYPSSLSLIARHARDRGVRLDDLGVRVAFVTSERLYDDQRADIEEVFRCSVANGYGGRDAGFIAHQCPEGGLHITAEDILVEIVDPAGNPLPPGERGEIVVTHFATGEFPFIRYRTGDVGALSRDRCACGRGLPLLGALEGRATDFVVAQDRTVMHGLALIYVLRDLPGIERFKIIQESLDLTRVLVEPGPGYGPGVARAVVMGLQQRLGASVTIAVEPVEHIPAERSGKFRYIVSHVTA